jgi:circadian clock protein KaiB
MKTPIDSVADFEQAAAATQADYVLRLYVAGATHKSAQAIRNIRAICEERLPGRYALEVVDVYQEPQLAKEDQILAVPTLIKRLPLPMRRLLGDLSNKDRVLLGLDLETKLNEGPQAQPNKPYRAR